MAFGKSFILSLVTVIAVGFFGFLLSMIIGEQIDQIVDNLSDLSDLSIALFGPVITFPYAIVFGLTNSLAEPITAGIIVQSIFYIVACLLAAVVAGKLGENKQEAFGSWFLTAMICAGVALTLTLIEGVYESLLTWTIVSIIIAGIVNGFLYGAVALLLNKAEFY
ncbi:MAG: hypothetical protein JW891_17265 [Candidatus Lokiarchaeota archaeon]|nr:hypothetical protein [Candidatus Lokiarchaeota archaeon]